jgi:hypothetical protein
VDWASANGLLVTRRAWDVVGGFDERYFPAYYEDVDLCLALAAQGLVTRYEPLARLVHRGSQSSSKVYRDFLLTRNRGKLVEKWGRTLDRFECQPPKESGPVFDAAVQRTITRKNAAKTLPRPARVRTAFENHRSPAPAEPTRASAELQADYHAYLEQRVVDQEQRISTLETYLSGLSEVRLRRWVGSRLRRRRS